MTVLGKQPIDVQASVYDGYMHTLFSRVTYQQYVQYLRNYPVTVKNEFFMYYDKPHKDAPNEHSLVIRFTERNNTQQNCAMMPSTASSSSQLSNRLGAGLIGLSPAAAAAAVNSAAAAGTADSKPTAAKEINECWVINSQSSYQYNVPNTGLTYAIDRSRICRHDSDSKWFDGVHSVSSFGYWSLDPNMGYTLVGAQQLEHQLVAKTRKSYGGAFAWLDDVVQTKMTTPNLPWAAEASVANGGHLGAATVDENEDDDDDDETNVNADEKRQRLRHQQQHPLCDSFGDGTSKSSRFFIALVNTNKSSHYYKDIDLNVWINKLNITDRRRIDMNTIYYQQ